MELAKDISNSDDIIDSRDITARIAELTALTEPDEYDAEELVKLKALEEAAKEYTTEWESGEALIRDTYFTDYAQEEAYDLGTVSRNLEWPTAFIDWEAAADNLKIDYAEVDFDGETYWIRQN
jgi:antirestriction protein